MPLRSDLGAALVALAVLLAATVLAVSRPGRRTGAFWGLAALLWLWADRPLEGAVLLVVGAGHGLTVGDLLVPATGLLLLLLLLRRLGQRPGPRGR